MREKAWGPFSGRQLTIMVTAAILVFSNVALQDPVSGVKASVDATHHVLVNGTTRPLPPSSPWRASQDFDPQSGWALLVGPVPGPINLTHLAVSLTAGADFKIYGFSTSGTSCNQAADTFQGTLYHIRSVPNPFFDSFPTPLQLRVPAGTKGCLYAVVATSGAVGTANASGYLGN
jgi:hypothetical protein